MLYVGWPAGTLTGTPAIDLVLAALYSQDQQRVRALIDYFEAPCIVQTRATTAGFPWCRAGEADGTLVRWFFVGGVEGRYYRAGEVPSDFPLTLPDASVLIAVSGATPDETSIGAEYVVIFAYPNRNAASQDAIHYFVRGTGVVGVRFPGDIVLRSPWPRTYLLPPRTN